MGRMGKEASLQPAIKLESMTKDFQKIINPVDRSLIERELTEDRFVRDTNKSGNKIYILNHHNAPHTMQEIGRLRELSVSVVSCGLSRLCSLTFL